MDKREDLRKRIEKHCASSGIMLKANSALQVAKCVLASYREWLEKHEPQAKREIEMFDNCESSLPDTVEDLE